MAALALAAFGPSAVQAETVNTAPSNVNVLNLLNQAYTVFSADLGVA